MVDLLSLSNKKLLESHRRCLGEIERFLKHGLPALTASQVSFTTVM
jgi:hypothetical protein